MHPGTRVELPQDALPARLLLDVPMSDEEYYAFCAANPDVRFERSAEGEIIIVPPAGFESDNRNADVVGQLQEWAKRESRGKVAGPSAEFFLPTGAAFSPDAAWISDARLAAVPRSELRRFPHAAPEFVVEVMSPSDRLKRATEKMREWIRGGVELAWLIDADQKTIYVFRPGAEPEKLTGIEKIRGEGPVAGFELDLKDIWAGL